MVPQSKLPQQSKMIWVNSLTLTASILQLITDSELSSRAGVAIVITGIVIPIINVFLRFITNQPVAIG